jgi:helicase
MTFRGLFVGIDRYDDVRVPWLSGAVRDAEALHALCTDALGGITELLADENATTNAIRAGLADLAACAAPDDIIMVTYAGHGSEDHYLVGHDADVDRIPATCLSLDDLADLVSAIPGTTLLCVLDCCFSGGLGSRVLSPPLRARGIATASVAETLDRFTGEGRVVLTASAENEEAHESPRHGHGLLTYRLLESLQGAEEVCDGDQVSLYKLVEYVTRMVGADAAQMGSTQTPTLRGKLDGAPLWPILKPGSRFATLFPDRVRAPATADIESLAAFGFSPEILRAWSQTIPALNELQLTAINDYGVLDGENLVVTAPTSSGKTMIGELVALAGAQYRRRAVFLLPMRALVNDKYEQFTNLYGPAGLRTIRATGEHGDDVPALLSGQFDVALLTYEKFTALGLGNPHVLNLAATVVIDEAQTLTDRTRGSNLEFLMTLLNNRRGQSGSPQIITLSAVVGDLGGLDEWLGARHLHSDSRPVPLVEGVINPDGSYRHLDEADNEQLDELFLIPRYDDGSRRLLIPLVQRLMSEGKKVLVFRQTKGESVACAVYLSQALGLPPAGDAIDLLPEGDASTSTQTLRQTLGAGVAFHNTDLDREERRVIEQTFRDPDSPVRIISATPTLAMGVNTPAAAVAIVGLTHPGPQPYSVAEYKNMVGRAGRLGFTPRGESYLIPEGALDPHRAWAGYVNGTLEDLVGDPRSLMLRVLATYPPDATGLVRENDVIGFLDSSLAAYQARRDAARAQWTLARLREGFAELIDAKLIEADGEGYRLTALGRFTGESGVHVDSIRRLVHGLQDCAAGLNSVGLVAAAQLANELDDVYLPVNAKARNTEVPRWPGVLAQQRVPKALIHSLQSTAQDMRMAVSRSKRASAAAYCINGVPIETIELQLTKHLRQSGGVAGAVRSVADRTRDLLPAVGAVVRELVPDHPVNDLVERTMLRLELGLPPELVDLIQRTGVTLTRAEWLKLLAAKHVTVESVLSLSVDQLTEILGSQMSADRLHHAVVQASDIPSPIPDVVLAAPRE